MADKIVFFAGVPMLAVDQSDGTWAIRIDGISGGGGAGDASAANQVTLNGLIGALNASAQTDPAAASATLLELSRGILQQIESDATIAAKATGGWTPSSYLSSADTNLNTIKNTAAGLSSILAFNFSTSLRYLKVFNKASNPNLAADTPVLRIPLPPAAASSVAGVIFKNDVGAAFGTGLAFAITGGIADTNTTAIGANEVITNWLWK